MAVTDRSTRIYTFEEARAILRQSVSPAELTQRREALKDSDRFLQEMEPITGEDIKDWIRRERSEPAG
jgi:hypothetical protein